MATMQNTDTPESMTRSMNGGRTDWSGEITPTPQMQQNRPMSETGFGGMSGSGAAPGGMMTPQWNGMMDMTRPMPGMQTPTLDMRHGQGSDVIESPTDLREAYLGSLKAMLVQNKGNYVVATFLIGTQGTVSWEGVLYEVGNDFVTISQPGRDRYIVCDIYSLKYIEFYDTQRRELCDRLIMENGRPMPLPMR